MSDLFDCDYGATPIEEHEKRDLIPSLSTKAELNAFENENIIEARRWAFSPRRLKSSNPVDEPYLRELHRRMFRHCWTWAGKYRVTEKHIGVEFHRISSEIATLTGDMTYWLEHDTYSPAECAIRFHHRLVAIHPFANGNGRHSRMMADLIAQRQWGLRFGWGAGTGDLAGTRRTYIDALRRADQHEYGPLIAFAQSGKV